MSTMYLISRTIDPIFAVSVGVAAAAVRISRDEKAKGHSTQDTIDSLKRRTAILLSNKPQQNAENIKAA